MRDRLPVKIENLDLPRERTSRTKNNSSYGYVSFMYILSVIITMVTLLVVFGLRK